MEAQILSIELNESFVLLALLFCSLFSCWAEHMTLKRYKKKWDVQKVKAFAEIITLITSEIDATSHNIGLIDKVYQISLREVKNEPWFALSEADKLLQNRKFHFKRNKEESK